MFGIGFDQCDLSFSSSSQTQVVKGTGINRENSAGCTVFGRHIGNGGLIRDRKMIQSVTVKLDKLADDTMFAQQLHNGQNHICRGCSFRQLASQSAADDARQQHRDRLPEHRGFRFNASDAPAQHADSVDHRCMGVGAYDRIRVGLVHPLDRSFSNHRSKIFKIDLMNDSGCRWNNTELTERILTPA